MNLLFIGNRCINFTFIKDLLREIVQLLSHVRLLRPHGLQHTRLPIHHQLPELAQTHDHW